MRIGSFKLATRKWTAGLVVAALALRALIPSGFMLESGHRLAIVICPDGFPADLLSQRHAPPADTSMGVGMGMDMPHGHMSHAGMPGGDRHAGGHSHSEHCLFTSGSSSGPTPQFAALVSIAQIVREVPAARERLTAAVRFVYVPQPRAPPILA